MDVAIRQLSLNSPTCHSFINEQHHRYFHRFFCARWYRMHSFGKQTQVRPYERDWHRAIPKIQKKTQLSIFRCPSSRHWLRLSFGGVSYMGNGIRRGMGMDDCLPLFCVVAREVSLPTVGIIRSNFWPTRKRITLAWLVLKPKII